MTERIKEKLKNRNLTEAPTAEQKFVQELPETREGETIIEVLDECAERADDFYTELHSMIKRGKVLVSAKQTNSYNPCFVGPTGSGKTSIIETWARDRGYEIVTINMMGDALDFLGVKTINRDADVVIDDEGNTEKKARVSTVATQAFDPFLHGKTKILFLDEINKTNPGILQSLYDLISFHTIQNGDEKMLLPKLLFTIGAMNPSEYGNRELLDPALKARLRLIRVDYDTKALKTYLIANYTQRIEEDEETLKELAASGEPEDSPLFKKWKRLYTQNCGRKDIVEALFADLTKFHWTDAAMITDADELDPVFVPRTLENALNNSNGTKSDFLLKVKGMCGVEATSLCNELLSTFQDKDHIANLIWEKDYTVKDDSEQESDAEKAIIDSSSEEDKSASQLKKSLYRKIADSAKK